MGFSSQSGSLGFRTQSVKGTYSNPGSGGIFMRTKSGAMGGARDLLIPDAEIGSGRDVADAYLGPIKFEGQYEFYARLDSLATVLKGALGQASSTSTGSGDSLVGTHVITPIDGANLPWISVEENIADGYEHFRYTDARVGSFHLEAESNGYLMGNCQLVALSQIAVPGASATANPSVDTGPMIVGSNITVSFGGVQLPGKSFSIDVNNNQETDDFRLGSLFLGDTTPKRREVTAQVAMRPDDSAMWRQAMYGTPNATSAGGQVTKDDFEIVCETYEFIGNTATVYSLTITAPQVILKPFEVTPSGDDVLQHDVEIQFLRPSVAQPLLTATIVNHLSSVK